MCNTFMACMADGDFQVGMVVVAALAAFGVLIALWIWSAIDDFFNK